MPNWHAKVDGQTLRLSHIQPDETGDVWAGEVLLFRGAPSWESHPELLAAASRITDPAVNRDLIRHAWTWDLPESWEGFWNCGDDRRYMTLSASGGSMNWRLVLRFPRHSPPHVFAAVASGFAAELQGAPGAKAAALTFTEQEQKEPGSALASRITGRELSAPPVAPKSTTIDCNAQPKPAAVEAAHRRVEPLLRRGKSRARTIAANRQEATS